MLSDRQSVAGALCALATQLEPAESRPLDIVVIGGAAMNVLGIISRPTRDVDVLALGNTACGADASAGGSHLHEGLRCC